MISLTFTARAFMENRGKRKERGEKREKREKPFMFRSGELQSVETQYTSALEMDRPYNATFWVEVTTYPRMQSYVGR